MIPLALGMTALLVAQAPPSAWRPASLLPGQSATKPPSGFPVKPYENRGIAQAPGSDR